MKEENIVNNEQVQENKDGAKAAKDVVNVLLKSLKATKIYPSNSPLLEKFLTDLFHAFERFFSNYSSLRLFFTKSSIISFGLPIYVNEDKDDNLAFLFFADGVMEFEIIEDATNEEIKDLVDIINQALASTMSDNDLVTLLWGRDFKSIKYKIKDEFLVEEGLDVDSEVEKLLAKSSTYSGMLDDAYRKSLEEDDKKSGNILSVYAEDNEFIEIKPFDKNVKNIYALTDDDIKYINDELKRCERIKPQEHITRVLFYILDITQEINEYREVTVYLQRVLEKYVEIADFESANKLLEKVSSIIQKITDDDERKAKLKDVIQFGGSEKIIESIGVFLNSGFGIDIGLFKKYISYLDKNCVISLIKLLGELDDIHHRRLIIDLLADKCRGDVKHLYRWLGDQRWFMVRNIVHILGRVGGEETVEALRRIIRHPEVRVRKEVLNALSGIRSVKVEDAFIEAINDDDEIIRILAVKYLGKIGSVKVKTYLRNLIKSKSFEERSISEKKDLCLAYAKVGGEEGISLLGDIMKRKSFFNRAKLEEMKISAAYGLSYSNQADAVKYLEIGVDSRNEEIRNLSIEGIKRLKAL